MTAYVHIGTPKTGTTSIQKFLSDNRDLLLKQGYYYPYQYAHGDHWKICKLFKLQSERICEEYFQIALSKDKVELDNLNMRFKDELQKQNLDKVILSSECILEFSTQLKDVYNMRQCLIDLGFQQIYIILYLRNPFDTAVSFYNTELLLDRKSRYLMFDNYSTSLNYGYHVCNHKKTIQWYQEVFGKENMIIRIFDKNCFIANNFIIDFLESIKIKWDAEFIAPCFQNETINLLGIQICRSINKIKTRTNLISLIQKYFSFKDSFLKFQPKKEIAQAYMDYFEESNEWVRKEFFPYKERLFSKKDLTDYKENYELKEMKPEYWDKIAEFIADIVKTKNQTIQNKDSQIETVNNEKQKLINEKLNLQAQINQLQNTLNSLSVKKQYLEISNLEQDLVNKKLNAKETNQNILIKELEMKKLQQELNINQSVCMSKEYSAKSRIQNQLSYKLGQAMIANSKSILGYIRMPFVLSYIKDKHKQEQKIYQEKIKKDPSLKLPPLENYPDYKEALKEKECFTYKLGQVLIQADKTWYKGGYVKMWFEIGKLKRGRRR